ncbi:MAG: hypothetical protein J4F98_09275 [Acidobacteria bacterium]|nr:hypothetical protein [Acidobacteriota bacterium]
MNEIIVAGLFVLGGAILGAAVTGAITWWQSSKNRRRSELTISTTSPTRLIEIDSSVAEDVEVLVRGRAVPAVYTVDARVRNTGTEAIERGKVRVRLDGDPGVLAVDVASSPPGAGAGIAAAIDGEEAACRLRFDYINPGEEILVRVLLSARPTAVTPIFRQQGVSLRVRGEDEPAVFSVAMSNVLILGTPFGSLSLTIPLYRRHLGEDRSYRAGVDRQDV